MRNLRAQRPTISALASSKAEWSSSNSLTSKRKEDQQIRIIRSRHNILQGIHFTEGSDNKTIEITKSKSVQSNKQTGSSPN